MKLNTMSLMTAVAATAFLGCESAVPTGSRTTTGMADPPLPRQQTAADVPQPAQDEPDASVSLGWEPMEGATCRFLDVRQRRVEEVSGRHVTVRVLADTTAEGRFYARVWLNERHTIFKGDFPLERGEVTFFTVTLPEPGEHRLFIDVELDDGEGNHTQCDGSLLVSV